MRRKIQFDAMKWKWENDLSVLIDGGDEIGEEIEAEKWLRRFVSCGSHYGFQLRHQYAET